MVFIRYCDSDSLSLCELAFSTAEIRSFSKANGRLSATWNTSQLNLLLVYRAASHSSNCKTIIIVIYTIIMKNTKVQTLSAPMHLHNAYCP